MNLQIDTNVFIWYATGNKRLKPHLQDMIESHDNDVFLSVVSLWEIAIKMSVGKLDMGQTIEEIREDVIEYKLLLQPLHSKHIIPIATMPLHHRDPFDRILVAQAMVEKRPIISPDKKLDAYNISRIW